MKRVGDILQRINDNGRIQSFLTQALISIIIAGITFVVYSVVMAGYDWSILSIFLLGSAVYVGWVFLFLKKRKELDSLNFTKVSENQSGLVQMVTGMQEIKLNNCEQSKLEEWKRVQIDLYDISVRSMLLGQMQNIGGTFIDQVKNILVSYWAARMVVEGEMTLGMMMAMQYVIGQLNAPIGQFIGFVQSTQDASISLERMGEMYNMYEEEPDDSNHIRQIPQAGTIEFRDVSFQYEGPASPKVLNKLNFTILPGKVNAIVGASGSGKKTNLKLKLENYNQTSDRRLKNTK